MIKQWPEGNRASSSAELKRLVLIITPGLLEVPYSLKLHPVYLGENPITTLSKNTSPRKGTQKHPRSIFPLK